MRELRRRINNIHAGLSAAARAIALDHVAISFQCSSPDMQYSKLAAACAVGLATRAHAQTTTPWFRESRLDVVGAVSAETRLNANASPARYAGAGALARVGFSRSTKTSTLLVSLQGGASRLVSSAALRSQVSHADVVAAWLAPVGSGHFAVGGAAIASGTMDTHRYLTPDARSMTYAFAWGGAGPAVLWRGGSGWRATSLFVTAPLGGVVAQSYSALRSDVGHTGMVLSAASPATLRNLSATLSSAPLSLAGFGARLEYRFDLLGYRATPGVRSMTQSLGVSLGRGRRR